MLQSNAVIDNAWGVLYESDGFALPNYPVKFVSNPWSDVVYVDADPGYRNAAFVERTLDSMSSSNPGAIYFVRPDGSSTIGHPVVSIMAAGLTA